MEDKTEKDNLGNIYHLVKTINTKDWYAIKYVFEELLNRNYGDYSGHVLYSTSVKNSNGDTIYKFNCEFAIKYIVKLLDNTTEFWELEGKSSTLFDAMKKQREERQSCNYCPVDRCILDCKICNPRRRTDDQWLAGLVGQMYALADNKNEKLIVIAALRAGARHIERLQEEVATLKQNNLERSKSSVGS